MNEVKNTERSIEHMQWDFWIKDFLMANFIHLVFLNFSISCILVIFLYVIEKLIEKTGKFYKNKNQFWIDGRYLANIFITIKKSRSKIILSGILL